ncbi:hypothetical protein QUA56_33565 [Microcoleus sp. N3A4]|uniref:hypothetical protein n=1 Tax=Microcoleus sp. N3A4 TaxID=3055379 RepID=UPI002FD0A5E7
MSGSEPETPKPDSAVAQEVSNELGYLKAENENLRQELAETKRQYMELLENSAATIGNLNQQLEEARSQLATLAADRDDLAQLKKQVKEDAAEVHREGRAIELEKVRWQGQLSDARSELAEAKATILEQNNKIRELERGYSFKPNPAESRLRLEIGELQEQLADLKQNSATAGEQNPAPTIDLSEQIPEIINFLKELLPPDTKWPKRVMPKLREFLESKED